MKSFANEGDVDRDVRVSRPVQVLERPAHNLFLGQSEVLDETLAGKLMMAMRMKRMMTAVITKPLAKVISSEGARLWLAKLC